MDKLARPSGIDAIGAIPWGTHFCQFYTTQADLTETLVPYFEAGLGAGEACLWVTGHTLEAQEAEAMMIDAVPGFKKFIASGQMEIVSMSDWYAPGDVFDSNTVLQGWIDKVASARQRGFTGLRLTGDTAWVERSGWQNFMEYEQKVNSTFRQHKLVALCTYCLDNCSASDVIDVCCQHQFALARREGTWELLESSSLKIAKDSLMQLNTELEARVEERTGELRSALHARDEFLAMLGHELRNPLAPIRTSADIIRTLTPPDSPLSASSSILSRQVGHLTRLVDDLLDVARVTKGKILLDLHEIALADVVAAAVEQVRPVIEQHLHSLSVTLPARTLRVNADATRLAQVFGNLLHNAAKYTSDGGALAISSRVVGEHVEVSVRDNGTGIPEAMLDSVFDLFAQLPRSLARSEGGLGIGLTLARRIVEMHGGTIAALSGGPNTGTEIVVRLALASAARGVAPPLAGAIANPAQAARILLVDDNEDGREAMGMLLQIHGHDVRFAGDGASALAIAASFMPTIVILDIGLPDIDGYEVARRLRAGIVAPATRLIALTGYGQADDIAAATAAGFDAHLLKPAQMEQVLAKLDEFVGR